MGRHADDGRKRGVATWPVIALGAVGVIGGLIAAYFIWLGSDAGSGVVDLGCTGAVRIEVSAGAGSATAMASIAAAFNDTTPSARSSCISAEVSTIDSSTVAAGLIDGWTGLAFPEPAVWIPDNAADLGLVTAGAPNVVAGHDDDPLATSPVVLAVAERNAASFPATFSWADLFAATAPASAIKLSDGQLLKLGVGDPRVDRSTRYALESVLAGAAQTQSAITPDAARAATAELTALVSVSAFSVTTGGLLGDLARGSSGFNAVPVVESALTAFNAGASPQLAAVYPQGATAGDSLTAIGLTAGWVSATEQEGAAKFIAFLKSPPAIALLEQSGLRVAGGAPVSAGVGVDRTTSVQILPSTSPGVGDALATAMGLPAEPDPTVGSTTDRTLGSTSDPTTGSATDPTIDPTNPTVGPSTNPATNQPPTTG